VPAGKAINAILDNYAAHSPLGNGVEENLIEFAGSFDMHRDVPCALGLNPWRRARGFMSPFSNPMSRCDRTNREDEGRNPLAER
jgi:hypothetical protein